MPILAKFDTADTMLARLQQATTFALIGLALAWVIVHASRGAVVVGIAGALFIVFAYAIVLAIEILFARWINRSEAVGSANATCSWECLNFCVRGALRLFHGGGRRLRRTDRRGGKVGGHITRPSW